MTDSPLKSHRRRYRSSLTGGIILMLIGSFALAVTLGLNLPHDWWLYWPWLLVVLGALQFAWPGTFRDRLGGYWLLVVGAWGLINFYGLFGLYWGTSWPIFIIALGLRVVLGGLFRHHDPERIEPVENQ